MIGNYEQECIQYVQEKDDWLQSSQTLYISMGSGLHIDMGGTLSFINPPYRNFKSYNNRRNAFFTNLFSQPKISKDVFVKKNT
jgi:hypothetical protein